MWCVAELNPEYVEKMEDVLAVYEKPYDASEPVVCLDEKPVTLHADLRPPTPAAPGRIAQRDNEYKRCGTANVFCAVEPKAGRHFTLPTPDRSAPEFAQAMDTLVSRYPLAHTIHPRIEIGWEEERLKGRSPSRDVCYRDFGRNL